jgi:hypothetical protein
MSNDVEMLQTDVMRFFAILCLCLMAIFTLVKALPMSPPAGRPTISEPADIKAEAQSLQLQIATLRRKLAESRTQVQMASIAAEQAAIQAKKAAEDEKFIISRLEQRQQELKAANRSLNRTRQKLRRSELKLAGLISDIDKKQQISSALKSRIKHETKNLQKIQIDLDRANANVSERQAEKTDTSIKPPEPDTPRASAREGFVLKFASDNALQTLIAGKRVNFFALTGTKAWKLRLTGGRPGYIASSNPGQIYEMEPATVPTAYRVAFQQQVAAFGRSAVTWGVTLPIQTTASINRLVKGQKPGDLVIMPDGKVDLN